MGWQYILIAVLFLSFAGYFLGKKKSVQSTSGDISQLRSLITKADTSKAALDLNNRLIAELAYLEVEKLKMQILSNQGLGGQSSRQVLAAAQQVKILHDDGEGDGPGCVVGPENEGAGLEVEVAAG